MSYFRELPDLDYQSFLSDSNSSQTYLRVKNIFRRCKLREDLQDIFTIFNKYEIIDGARPDTVAKELYGKSDLDWIVLMSAGITNVRDEWPLSDRDVYNYAENLYGTKLLEPRFYETVEIKDTDGKLIIAEGERVQRETFSITYYDPNDNTSTGAGFVTKTSVRAVNNLEYEIRKNEKKRTIYILRSEYLQQFLNDMRQEMIYSRSSQYVSEDLARTENTRITLP